MPTVHARTVQRAAEIVEGVEVLAARLGVDDENLRRWMEGEHPVPPQVFFRCVDIVNDHQLDEISGQNLNNSVPKGRG